MVNRFHMILLVAIRPRSGIVILDENHNKNLGEREKVDCQATSIANHIETDIVCQLFHHIQVIVQHIVIFVLASNSTYINDKF